MDIQEITKFALNNIVVIVGILGVLVRRNAIVVFMCIELMLNAANLALVAFSRHDSTSTSMVSAVTRVPRAQVNMRRFSMQATTTSTSARRSACANRLYSRS